LKTRTAERDDSSVVDPDPGLPDPDKLVRAMDPDPSITKQK
jgi:hypothetical protein